MQSVPDLCDDQDLIPPGIAGWFRSQGWTPRPHQLGMVAAARDGMHALLIAPTGAGKTLAGFLPSLIDLSERPREGLHTLYISPLKALAVDIQRNLEAPIASLRLPIRAETRTGDTPEAKRARQRSKPPHILMTTVESLALMVSYPDAAEIFRPLRRIVIDELHALAGTKRGDQLALCLARLSSLAPHALRAGLSATVADPDALTAWLSPTGRLYDDEGELAPVCVVRGRPGAPPKVEILATKEHLPWAGHMALHAMGEVYQRIRDHGVTLIFVNTRAQAELAFQELWRLNTDNLPIALHHGSLAVEQRRKVEAAMAAGKLRAVVATSSLDLGIDWAEIDLVVQVGAPKGVSRLLQRIGRANHRLDEASKALLVPGNRFEVLECEAAVAAIKAGTLDGEALRPGALDVLAQHVTGVACSGPFSPDALYAEVVRASPYANLSRDEFDDVFDFVATGGYALGAYDKFKRLTQDPDTGLWQAANGMVSRQYRLNIGTIVEEVMLNVRLNRGQVLGRVEEYFVNGLVPGDTFIFAGQLLKFVGIRENDVIAAKGGQGTPKVPAYAGGRLPLSTHLADRVRALLSDPRLWDAFPDAVQEWLRLQQYKSVMPDASGLLVETFPRNDREYLVAYCFEGRNAHQTLGMLLTRRMERAGLHPLGFVATDYVLAIWSLKPATNLEALFDQDMLGDDLEAWMEESSMLKRLFRNVAVISGLIERRHPGLEKTGKQVMFSADLIYDVLRRHEPGHVLLRATRADAAAGLTDVRRVAGMLSRVQGRIQHRRLDRISPLAVPVILEIGREHIQGSAIDALLDEAVNELLEEAVPELMAPPTVRQGRLL